MEPLEFIRFSEDDLNCHSNLSWHTPTAVTVFLSRIKARCLLWQPRANYTEDTLEGIAYELERRMRMQNPDKEAVEYLRLHGQADIVDFVLKDRLWQPEIKHLSRLEKFEIRDRDD